MIVGTVWRQPIRVRLGEHILEISVFLWQLLLDPSDGLFVFLSLHIPIGYDAVYLI